jgi:hypothetical protein
MPSEDIKVLETYFEQFEIEINDLLIGFPNSNVPDSKLIEAIERTQKLILGARQKLFTSKSNFVDMLARLKNTLPSAEGGKQ